MVISFMNAKFLARYHVKNKLFSMFGPEMSASAWPECLGEWKIMNWVVYLVGSVVYKCKVLYYPVSSHYPCRNKYITAYFKGNFSHFQYFLIFQHEWYLHNFQLGFPLQKQHYSGVIFQMIRLVLSISKRPCTFLSPIPLFLHAVSGSHFLVKSYPYY